MPEEHRQLPNDTFAENCVISGMMLTNNAIALAITELIKDDFYLKRSKILFITIEKLFNKNIDVDLLTLIDQLKKDGYLEMVKGVEFVNDLSDLVSDPSNILNHIKIVKEKSELRKQILAYTKGIDECYSEINDPKEIISETFNAISSSSTEEKLNSLQSALKNTLAKIDKIKDTGEGEQSAWLGISTIDREVIPKAGRLIVIAGRPAHGKSTLMIQSAIQSGYHNKKSCIISMEMEEDDVVVKQLSYVSGIDNRKIEYTHDQTKDEVEKVAYAAEVLHDLNMFISTKRNITPVDIRAIAIRAKSFMGGLDNIYLDHLQLTSNPKYPKMIDRITENSRQLKMIAGDLNCCVIALSQLNRGLENRIDKRPKLSDLRESGAIEQDADIVIGICSFHNYKDDKNMEDGIKIKGIDFMNHDLANLGVVEILKNRYGGLWTSAVNYEKSNGKFIDWEEA